MTDIARFIDHYKDKGVATMYDSGVVAKRCGNFVVGYEMSGAKETFSVGQPVYDKDKNLMGYLGIGLFEHLDYATDDDVGHLRIPVEHWTICLPTPHCVVGKEVFTYWQTMKGEI